MSKDEWNNIVYREVPALAMKKYRNAFKNHNLIEFKEYIEKVKSGEETIKAATLYPYNIMESAGLTDNWRNRSLLLQNWDEVLEEQWKALPNYVEGENNIMIMADTSGSMSGRPIATSVGLAVYFAERNHGPYKDKFIVFAGDPEFVELKGKTLNEKASKRGKQEPFLAVVPNGPLPAGIFSEPYLFVGLKIIMKDGTICAIYVSKEKTQVGTDQYKEDRKEAEAIRICLSN